MCACTSLLAISAALFLLAVCWARGSPAGGPELEVDGGGLVEEEGEHQPLLLGAERVPHEEGEVQQTHDPV
jgi:hypothetical protein